MNKVRALGVVMDPIEHIKPYKDTTLALMLAAQKRGWVRREKMDCLEWQSIPANARPRMAGQVFARGAMFRQGWQQ